MWRVIIASVLAACVDTPARDNPLDPEGSAWGEADPRLEARWSDGAVTLSWRRVTALEVTRYRLLRLDRAVDATTWEPLAEVPDPGVGDALSWVDDTRIAGRPDIAWRITLVTSYGETGVVGEATFVSDADLDDDGAIGDDCDAGDATVHPGADEACNTRDDDCDGATDEGGACVVIVGDKADGEPCASDAECAGGDCGAAGLCGPWHEPCDSAGQCGGLACARELGVCTAGCTADDCPAGQACVGGWCLVACQADVGCGEGASCLASVAQPSVGGGCGAIAACRGCRALDRCVAGPDGTFACCADADGDGRFALDCAWGTDCDDADPDRWTGCGLCATREDCGGVQCVLLPSGEGLCGGPARCHCPAGSACATGEDPPRCVAAASCVEDADCRIAHVGSWTCEAVASLGEGRRCVCDDPIVCPECLLDAECPEGATCADGRCVAP